MDESRMMTTIAVGHGEVSIGYWADGTSVLVIEHDFNGNSALAELSAAQARDIGLALLRLADDVRARSRATPRTVTGGSVAMSAGEARG